MYNFPQSHRWSGSELGLAHMSDSRVQIIIGLRTPPQLAGAASVSTLGGAEVEPRDRNCLRLNLFLFLLILCFTEISCLSLS